MTTDLDRITTPERQPEDTDAALRPKSFDALVRLALRMAAK